MLRNFLLILAMSGLLSACAVDDGIPNFERMSEEELFEYNRGRPLAEMIVCNDGDRAFSRVRRRTCATVEAMYGSVRQADQLGILNSVPGYIQNESF